MLNWHRWALPWIAFAVLGAPLARAFDVQSGIGFVAITNALEHDEFVSARHARIGGLLRSAHSSQARLSSGFCLMSAM